MDPVGEKNPMVGGGNSVGGKKAQSLKTSPDLRVKGDGERDEGGGAHKQSSPE